MLVAALIVGVLAAYYLGLRAGAWAAGATAILFMVAMVAPRAAILAYGVVAAGLVGLCWIGPKLKRPADSTRAFGAAKRLASRLWRGRR